jgi:hypothetical protein
MRALVVAFLAVLSGCAGCQTTEPVVCADTQLVCDERCVDPMKDRRHCGGCGQVCEAATVCSAGACLACADGERACFNRCVNVATDQLNCGACGARCEGGTCTSGGCVCQAPLVNCVGGCFDLNTSALHCGSCQTRCSAAEVCDAGACVVSCDVGLTACDGLCVNQQTSRQHCGGCNRTCAATELCDAGTCAAPPDLDGDGYTVLTGDCCELLSQCAAPLQVHPGALEVLGNGLDDDCDGRIDPLPDAGRGCDEGLAIGSAADAGDYARAMDLCEGFQGADVTRADGSRFAFTPAGIGVLERVGALPPIVGQRVLALSSGRATGGFLGTGASGGSVTLSTCGGPGCVSDWLGASNGSLKAPGMFPTSYSCTSGSSYVRAFDSVMLQLHLVAPARARAFEVQGRFYSLEYPEYVCTPFNDQVVFLSSSRAAGQPLDANLLTFTSSGVGWPIGINVASGTPLFQACEPQAQAGRCWDYDVSANSCQEGTGALAGTIFDKPGPTACVAGGATSQLLVRGNVLPNEAFDLRIAIWDVGDAALDSALVLDGFRWLTAPVTGGTTGVRVDGGVID